ncbi:MAG: ABC transporter permease [Pikeienuella sp.]|uniref:ABC transporter permease n=1 Tax=Pikeienuella sp. TaxID=2831957 RepID=UPI003919258A
MSDFLFQLVLTLDATLRVATPLILCGMAGILSERSGVIDIGLEGKMLAGAFSAAAVAHLTGSPWAGLMAAVMTAVLLAALHGFACITARGNQVISGLAINILASALTVTIGIALFRRGGATPSLTAEERLPVIDLPLAETLSGLPVIGDLYSEILSGHRILVYVALLAVPLTAFLLYRTRFGLRLRAVGESPEAVDSAGISVHLMRYKAVLLAGVFCGLAGAYLSIAHGGEFGREMSAGKGYIALAAVIFGKWRPVPTLFACLLFGFLGAAADRLQGREIPFIGAAPTDLMIALPYILTVVLLAGFIGKATPPRDIGVPYPKGK